jgi:hypothetical protein
MKSSAAATAATDQPNLFSKLNAVPVLTGRMIPRPGKPIMRRRPNPLSLRVQRLQRLPGIGTISLIHILAEVGSFLDRFDSAERAAAGYQPPPLFRCHRSACAVDPA